MIRTYICDNCEHEFSISQGMHDPLKKKCPKCSKHTLYQDLKGQYTSVKQEPKTLGHLANRNREKMGTYELESKEQEANRIQKLKNKKNKTWYNPEGKNLKKELKHLKTNKEKMNYIMTGNENRFTNRFSDRYKG